MKLVSGKKNGNNPCREKVKMAKKRKKNERTGGHA